MTNKWILPTSTAIAVMVSFALFAFMASLVQKPQNKPITTNMPYTGITTNLNEPKPEDTKVRKSLPPKPDTTTPPDRQTVEIFDANEIAKTAPSFETGFKISDGIQVGNGGHTIKKPTLGGSNDNTDARAIVQIPPQYPIEAQQKGIEGWVKLSFSIDTDGSVTNIQVIDSQPKRIFDRAARKALKGWRYKAKFVDAVPVMQHNLMIQLDFEIE